MNDEKRRQRVNESLDSYLKLHGKRRTPERYAILDCALGMKRAFGADELCESLASGGFTVSLATVYNALRLFADAGIARSLRLEGRSDRWEISDGSAGVLSVRLVCAKCGKVREVRDAELARMLSLKRFTSFNASLFDLRVSGACTRCRSVARRKK